MTDPAWDIYRKERMAHWNEVACRDLPFGGLGGYYHRRLKEIYSYIVPKGMRVLELGCGRGDLLASLEPSFGLGVDLSAEMIRQARKSHPKINFIHADCHDFIARTDFDFIVLSDLINDIWDVQKVFQNVRAMSGPRTRVVINTYNRLWELPLFLARKIGLATPLLSQNWLSVEDIQGLLRLTDMEMIKCWGEVILPLPIPVLSKFFNLFLVKIWPFNKAALTNFIVARTIPRNQSATKATVSVIVPARNEAGNIGRLIEEVPQMGTATEIIFVEGDSTDDTASKIAEEMKRCGENRCLLYHQVGKGKGDAVRLGFARAKGEILMILDADLTVRPSDLPRFYEALQEERCEFANGVRLVYPMEKEAMRFLNLLGNKFFSLAFSWLLGQPVKDTLCGTKALWRKDYERIAANRSYFGEFDPFGDFDLLFGAAKLNLKILDIPIRYGERVYGRTNISRWRHGWLLLKMIMFASRRLKFI